MNSNKTVEKWSEGQLKYAAFLSRGKTNIQGQKRTNGHFAQAIGVGEATLYRWRGLDGFLQLVFDLIMKEMVADLPAMTAAIRAKATGQTIYYKDSRGKMRELKPDTQAFMALMRQANLLKSDKADFTTDGKPLPTPVMNLTDLRQASE